MTSLGHAMNNHDPPDFVIALHKKAPVTACRPRGFRLKRSGRETMSFIATFISLAVMIGAAVVILTAVVGYGCYNFLRDLFDKRPRQLDV